MSIDLSQGNPAGPKLAYTGSRWYLLGWDANREDWRTFRVDRISGRPATGRRFVRREIPGGDPAAYVSRAVSSSPYPVQARIVLHAPLERMAERVPPQAGRLERIDDERCLLEAGAYSLDALAYHLALLGVELEVQEPPELLEHLRALAARLTRATVR